MYKKLLTILLVSLTTIIFAGCANTSTINSSRFYKTNEIYVIDGTKYAVNVDSETDNVYLVATNSKEMFPLYGEDDKIAKHNIDSKNFTKQDDSNVDSSRFYKIDEKYEIDKVDYNLFVDRKTDDIYLVGIKCQTIMPLFGNDGKIAKNSNLNKLSVQN